MRRTISFVVVRRTRGDQVRRSVRTTKVLAVTAALASVLMGCGQASTQTAASADETAQATEEAVVAAEEVAGRETITQVALLQSLLQGDYYGSVSIGDLKTRGDIGIGTFDGLNGELIMVDGVLHRAKGDGSVDVPDDTETIPFANVTFFDSDEEETLAAAGSFAELEEMLNARVNELGANRFYFARIDGTFKTMNVRSEYAQSEPYQPLVEVLEHDQTFFDFEDVEGTLVALYCPQYMKELNNAGWHLHFVSKDGSKGGHVLNLSFDEAKLALDATDKFEMMLPDEEFFSSIDFSLDRSEEVRKAERND